MNCRLCGVLAECPAHGIAFISEYEFDKEFNDYGYGCDYCIQECGSGAFGCIMHWCSDMMGAFSGKPRVTDDMIQKSLDEILTA